MAQNFDLFEKPLGQLRPDVITPVTIYQLQGIDFAIIKEVLITNLSGSNKTWSLYYDIDGTVFDPLSEVFNDQVIRGNVTLRIPGLWWPLNIANSGFGVKSSSIDTVLFTLLGVEGVGAG